MQVDTKGASNRAAGLAGWVLSKLSRDPKARPRLTLVDRISLAPRQSLALIEAEGRRFLVATSQEGAPVIYPLDPEEESAMSHHRRSPQKTWRVL